jgi:MFS family permease
MRSAIHSFGALFASTFLFLTGNGLLNTLLSTRMALEEFTAITSGIVLSCYFIGLLVGSFSCRHLIERVGHIRAFTVFAAGTAAAALFHGLVMSALFWGLLRFICGATTFGMFMVLESWLNECTESAYRGRVFAIYMTLSYLGIGVGQQLLTAGDVMSHESFIIAGILFAMCLMPVSATETTQPRLPEHKQADFIAIFKKAPLGMLGCVAAGLTNSAFFSMAPVMCTQIGLSLHQLSWIMTITVFCGLTAQWLVGALSDRFGRTRFLSLIVLAMIGVSGGLFIYRPSTYVSLAIPMGLWGALMFAVYPVSVARAHDIFEGRETVAVSTGLLLAYSMGASVSPVLASVLMNLVKSPFGIFAFWFLVNGGFGLIILFLVHQERIEKVAIADQVSFMPMKSSSPIVMALDPRNTIHADTKLDRKMSEQVLSDELGSQYITNESSTL